MKKLVALFLLLSIIKSNAQTPAQYFPTIYNSDFDVPPPSSRKVFNDSTGNMFHQIYFEEYEVYEGGFKEKKYRLINFDLLKLLKNKSIIFNPNSMLPEKLFGFYKKADQKQEFFVNSQYKKNSTGEKPNVFKVLDININVKTNEVEYLVLKKEQDQTAPVLYFFPKAFIKAVSSKTGNLGDLGLFVKEYLDIIKSRFAGQEYVLKYHNGSEINIPEKAFLPASHSLLIDHKKDKLKSNTKGLALVSAYYGNFFYGALGYMIMKNRYEKLNNSLGEFREKQRELLYDFDLNSSIRLKNEDFGENKFWKFNEIFLLEESGFPVISLVDDLGRKILVFAEMGDLLLNKNKVVQLKDTYGNDIIKRLFDGEIEYGWPISMIRFALGYETTLVSIEQTENSTEEIYGYQNLWLYFKDGKYYKQEWNYYRNPYSQSKD